MARKANERRVTFSAPPDYKPVASVWITLGKPQGPQGAQVTVTLQHDYPDLKPEAGWRLSGRYGLLEVTAVSGLVLTCRKVEV